MKAYEFISEKKKRRRPRAAAYGPGPFGGYGYATGYSGDAGVTGEASYPGNIGAMEVMKFFQIADDKQKKLFKDLVAKGKKGLAWKLIQDTVGVKLQGKEFEDQHPNERPQGPETKPTYNVEEGLGDMIAKVKDKFAELKNKLATEGGETKQMMDIYKLALQKKATPQQIQFANNQFKDVLKMLGLGAFTALPIPGGALLIVALEKLLNKKGISIMPSAFQAA